VGILAVWAWERDGAGDARGGTGIRLRRCAMSSGSCRLPASSCPVNRQRLFYHRGKANHAGSDDILSLAPPKADLRVAYGAMRISLWTGACRRRKGRMRWRSAFMGGTGARKYESGILRSCVRGAGGVGVATANVGNTGAWEIRVEDGRGTFADISGGVSVFVARARRGMSSTCGG